MFGEVLVLTPWYAPHKVIAWQSAVTLVFLDKVDVVEEYEHVIASPSFAMRAPAVVRLKRTVGGRAQRSAIKFSRTNVLLRDGFRCQYCGVKALARELTYDHVVPRSRGGRTTWENIATACRPCNERKGGRTPTEAKMPLATTPAKPTSLPMPSFRLQIGHAPDAWAAYVA